MITTLHRHIDPDNYHPDAVAGAANGDIADLSELLLILRLGIELHANNYASARKIVALLETQTHEGYALFQIKTAAIIMALQSGAAPPVQVAVDGWLDARKTAPQNFLNDVLDAPELAPFLIGMDPARLAPPEVARYEVTDADRALIADFDAARELAVTENMEWLKPMGITGSIKSIAAHYRIVNANHHLREVTLGTDSDWPELVVSVDVAGVFLGSFIAH